MSTWTPSKERVVIDAFTPTSVRKELLKLSAIHTQTDVLIIEDPLGNLGLHVIPSADLRAFYAELERLEDLVKTPLDEPILEDDEILRQGNLYVYNGGMVPLDRGDVSVGQVKRENSGCVIQRCDLVGRRLRLPPEVANHKIMNSSITGRVNTPWYNTKKRRPRNSHKIKKVK